VGLSGVSAMTARHSESIDREHLAALKALRRAGLDPTVIDVRRNVRGTRSR
jgi:hypothetical protein